jgi:hypothetical protein
LFTSTDSLGNYELPVDTGRYTLDQIIPEERKMFIRQVCPANPSAIPSTSRFGRYRTGKNFANQVDDRPIYQFVFLPTAGGAVSRESLR